MARQQLAQRAGREATKTHCPGVSNTSSNPTGHPAALLHRHQSQPTTAIHPLEFHTQELKINHQTPVQGKGGQSRTTSVCLVKNQKKTLKGGEGGAEKQGRMNLLSLIQFMPQHAQHQAGSGTAGEAAQRAGMLRRER